MELCTGTSKQPHDEICFEGRKCPFCEHLVHYEDIEQKLEDATEDNGKLEEEIEELSIQLSECKEHCDGCPNKLKCLSVGKT